jgi:arylsulfatase A-like enzyme
MSHGTYLYDELLSVPLIIKLPGQRTGSVAHGTFSLLNLVPSILNYLHYDASHLGLQGNAAKLKGLKDVTPSVIYSSTMANAGIAIKDLECLRVGDLKYIVDRHLDRIELYDVRKDPKEEHNIADQQKSTIVHFDKMLRTRDKEIDNALHIPGEQNDPWKAADEERCSSLGSEMRRTEANFTKKEENRLRALGYLQ